MVIMRAFWESPFGIDYVGLTATPPLDCAVVLHWRVNPNRYASSHAHFGSFPWYEDVPETRFQAL